MKRSLATLTLCGLALGCGASVAPWPGVDRAALEIEPGNLVANPSFELGALNGWMNYMCTSTVVTAPDAPHGTHVAEMTAALSGRNYFDIDDNPATVSNVKAGDWFRGSAWFSAANASAIGKQAFIALRVRGTSTSFAREGYATLSSSGYAQAVVVTQATEDGELEVYLGETGATSGDVIRADLVTAIRLLPDAGVPPLPADAGATGDAGSPVDAGSGLDGGPSVDGGLPSLPRAVNLKGWSCSSSPAALPGALLAVWLGALSRRRTGRRQSPAAKRR